MAKERGERFVKMRSVRCELRQGPVQGMPPEGPERLCTGNKRFLDVYKRQMEAAVADSVKPQFVEMNRIAFGLGYGLV